MRKNLRRVKIMLTLFGESAFYVISLYEGHIDFQGRYSSEILKKAKN